MHIFWRIRYIDRADHEFKNLDLFLDTDKLAPELKAAVELALETQTSAKEREFLKFRPLFRLATEIDSAFGNWSKVTKFNSFCLPDYFEDETGKEITLDQIGHILTGNPTARILPRGKRQHDIDFMLSPDQPMPVAEITLSPDEINILGYFRRDLRELCVSTFIKDGPGQLTFSDGRFSSPTTEPTLKTATTDEEIRSFVTVYRRLYMEKEPANFMKAAAVFGGVLNGNSFGKWVTGEAQAYDATLNRIADSRPFVFVACNFTRKRLIDVFLYTRYAHQPDKKRQRQYNECLTQVGGSKVMLTWLFLAELWKSSLQIISAGRTIVLWFEGYCAHHGLMPDVLPSVVDDAPGIGTQEKESSRKNRLFREKAEELAKRMWTDRGLPAGGHLQFLNEAHALLRQSMNYGG